MFTKHKLLVWILFDIWGSLTLVYSSKYKCEPDNINKKQLLLKSILTYIYWAQTFCLIFFLHIYIWGSLTLVYKYECESSNINKKELLPKSILTYFISPKKIY